MTFLIILHYNLSHGRCKCPNLYITHIADNVFSVIDYQKCQVSKVLGMGIKPCNFVTKFNNLSITSSVQPATHPGKVPETGESRIRMHQKR